MHQNHSFNQLITIITVTYNAESTIEKSILSIIEAKRKYSKMDYIIIDGSSTDKTKSIIKKYENFLYYWISEPDAGIYDAMNKGWNKAKSSYILFLGSGDTLVELPDFLPKDDHKRNIYYGDVLIGESLYIVRTGWRFKVGNNFHHQALLIHKDSHPQFPFNIKYHTYADYDLNMRLYREGFHFIYISNFKAFAFPNGFSSKLNIKELLHIINNNFGFFWALIAVMYILQNIVRNNFVKK